MIDEPEKSIEFFVSNLLLDTRTNTPIAILRDASNKYIIPIYMGEVEAEVIACKLNGKELTNPMKQDFSIESIDDVKSDIAMVSIVDLEDDIFLASITIVDYMNNYLSIDACPSVAIALGFYVDAPIYVHSKVIELVANKEIEFKTQADQKEQDEFKKFIDSVKASDFNIIKGNEDIE
jgi:bifunctional DNase/RNase